VSRRFKKGRNVSGIVLLDKPTGITSNAALQRVKRLYDARKAGHTGSLDPLASGLLPICMGEATKLSTFLLAADKRYVVRCQLGVRTASGDAEGPVVATRPVGDITADQLQAVLDQFKGVISQVPSMYSAVKHQGQPLYKLAHQGLEVEREAREVQIYELRLIEQRADELDLEVHCSKGTYVRTLVEDIGEMLGCGAHVTALRRTAAGPFRDHQMVSMETLEALAEDGLDALDARMLPLESALGHWPDVDLTDDSAYYLRKGQPVLVPHAPTAGWVRLYAGGKRFLGVGEILDDGRVAPRRLIGAA
jgi:tRNA pseudouridine55 synthase